MAGKQNIIDSTLNAQYNGPMTRSKAKAAAERGGNIETVLNIDLNYIPKSGVTSIARSNLAIFEANDEVPTLNTNKNRGKQL